MSELNIALENWMATRLSSDTVVVTNKKEKLEVCRVYINRGSSRKMMDQQWDAASLIAAAPELYAALDDLMERYISVVNNKIDPTWNPYEEKEVDAARKSLKKARGE